ncbi:hypothetical protein TSOC_010846, partial [Tetrabaena socialis]
TRSASTRRSGSPTSPPTGSSLSSSGATSSGSLRSSTARASSTRRAPRAWRSSGAPTRSCGDAGWRGARGCRWWTPTCGSWRPR